MTVVSFGDATVGASTIAVGTQGAPKASLIATKAGSLIYGVGIDCYNATARTVGANQLIVHQWVRFDPDDGFSDTYWVQARTAPAVAAGATLQLNDTAPTTNPWNLAVIEIIPRTAPTVVPVITVMLTPSPNATGWRHTPVTAHFTCLENGSPLSGCPVDIVTTTEGANQTVKGTVTDVFGNAASVTSDPFNIDLTSPAVTIASPADGSRLANATASVSGTAADALSGIASVICNSVAGSVGPTGFTCAVSLTPGTNAVRLEVRDRADNIFSTTMTLRLDLPPVANAGPDQSIHARSLVRLDGSRSSDPDGDPLSYRWAFSSKPTGSTASLSNEQAVNPTFSADQTGRYVLALVVNDGLVDSIASSVNITSQNASPLANAGGPYSGEPGTTVSVDGSGSSDPDSDSLTYAWDFGDGGTATGITPSHIYTSAGQFTVALTVDDGHGGSQKATTTATITAATLLRLTVTPRAARLSAVGTEQPLLVTGAFSDGQSRDLTAASTGTTYESSNPFVAAVASDGRVKSVANGSATITVHNLALQATADIVVEAGVTLTSLKLTPPASTLRARGATEQLVLMGTFSDGTARDLTLASAGSTYESTGTGIVSVSADGLVTAGSHGSSTITAHNDQLSAQAGVTVFATTGTGFLRGAVFDDSKGLPLAGARVGMLSDGGGDLTPPVETTTDDRGQFVLAGRSGDSVVRIEKIGYSSVERAGQIPVDAAFTVLDARLTPLDARANPIASAFADRAQDAAGVATIDFAAGDVPTDTSMRLTAISGQGLQGTLPLGWSPAAAIDISPAGVVFQHPVSMRLKNAFNLPAGATINVVSYGAQNHQWIATNAAQVSADATQIVIPVSSSGQVALLLPDLAPFAPPSSNVGDVLSGVASVPLPSTLSASGLVVPRTAPPGDDVHATGKITVQSPSLPSGATVQAHVTERYDLFDTSTVVPQPFTQDFVLYARPPTSASPSLAASFPITPSLLFTINELQLGTVHLDVTPPGSPIGGSVLGAAGGQIVDAAGDTLQVASGLLSSNTIADLRPLTPAEIPAVVPASLELLGAVNVDLPGSTLSGSALLSIARPSTLAGDAQVVVAQVFSDLLRGRRLRIVALGLVQADRIVTSTQLSGLTLPGVTAGGQYVFLQPTTPLGFVTGNVFGTGGTTPQSGSFVSADTTAFADLTGPVGVYIVGGQVGQDTHVTAADSLGNVASGVVSISAASAVVPLNLTLGAIVPTVMSTNPTAGAQSVPLSTAIRVQFSRQIVPGSVTTSTVQFLQNGTPVSGTRTLTSDGRTLVLQPAVELQSKTVYTLSLTAGITDTIGHGLALFAPLTFTTVDTSKAAQPTAGQITALLPDADGLVMIVGTQGTSEPGSAVTSTNIRTQETFTVLSQSDGSFRIRLAAALGDDVGLTFRNGSGQDSGFSITQFENPDGTAGIGASGGTIRGPDGRVGTVLSRALVAAGTFRLAAGADPSTLPSLPGGFSYVDGFQLLRVGGQFNGLQSITLSESQNRFAPVTSTSAPYESPGSLVVSPDFLANGNLNFTASVTDAKGNRASITGSSLVVPASPSSDNFEADVTAKFPTLFLTGPQQVVVNQEVDVDAIAPTARVDFHLPVPSGLTGNGTVLLAQVVDVNGEAKLFVVDELRRVNSTTGPALMTSGRGLPGTTQAGSYAVIASDQVLTYATGKNTGPAAVVALEGSPFVSESDQANASFVVPVRAGQPFTLDFVDPATGVVRGSAQGQAPPTGHVDLGEPLGNPTALMRVTALPDANSIVDGTSPLVFSFSEPIDVRTASLGTIVVTDSAGSRVFGTYKASDDQTRITFTPLRRWRFGTTFTYGVSTKVLALSGARLDRTFSGQFTTFTPRVLSTTRIDTVRDVAVAGNLLLIGGSSGLSVLDISSGDAPTLVSQVAAAGGVAGVGFISNTSLTDRGGNPVSSALGIAASGSPSTSGLLQVFDLTTPSTPTLLGSAQLTTPAGQTPAAGVPNSPGTPGPIAIAPGQQVAVAVGVVGVETVDLSKAIPNDPAHPGAALGPRFPAAAFENVNDVAYVGDKLLTVGVNGLTILNATTLERLGSVSTTGNPLGVAGLAAFSMDVNGDGTIDPVTEIFDLAVVANGSDGMLQFFNVSTPAMPALIGVVHFDHPATSVALSRDENLAYVGGGAGGLSIVDLAGPTQLQPIDLDFNGLDDRILGVVTTPGSAGRVALNLGRGVSYVANDTSGVSVIQLIAPRTRFTELLRDPVKAATGDEESILETRQAFTSDDALSVTVEAVVPPGSNVFLAIDEVDSQGSGLLSFLDGTRSAPITNGVNTLQIQIDKTRTTAGTNATLRIQDAQGKALEALGLRLRLPDTSALTLASLFVVPQPVTLSSELSFVAVGVGGRFSNGLVLNLTSSTSGTGYATEDDVVALVSHEGVVTGKAGGDTRIVAVNGAVEAAAAVHVGLAPIPVSLAITPKFIAITDTSGEAFRTEASFSDGSVHDVTADPAVLYGADDPNIVTITPGLLTFLGEGGTFVNASYQNLTTSASVHVSRRPLTHVTGIQILPPAEIFSNRVSAPASAIVDGSGALDGISVTFALAGFTPNPQVSVAKSDLSGDATSSLTGWSVPGIGQLTVSVVDPSTGIQFQDSRQIEVKSHGDQEPNDTDVTAGNIEPEETVNGTVGGSDAKDTLTFTAFEAGIITVRVEIVTDGPSTLRLQLRAAEGTATSFETTQPSDNFSAQVRPGRYFLEFTSGTSEIQYTVSYSLAASPPVITAVLPPGAKAGTQVVVEGDGFSIAADRVQVRFGNVAGRIVQSTPTAIVCVVPAGAVSASVVVSVGSQTVTGPFFDTGVSGAPLFPAVTDVNPDTMMANPVTGVVTSFTRLLVQFDESASRPDVSALAATLGGTIIGHLPLHNDYQIEFPTGNLYELASLRSKLTQQSIVLDTTLETLVPLNGTADAEMLPNCSGRHECSWPMNLIKLFDAYRYVAPYKASLAPVHIAVMDSGLRVSNMLDKFSGIRLKLWDFSQSQSANESAADFTDLGVHGTLVTAALGAQNTGKKLNGVFTGVYGATPIPAGAVTISMIKFGVFVGGTKVRLSASTGSTGLVATLQHVELTPDVLKGVNVLNMSWGDCLDKFVEKRLRRFLSKFSSTLFVVSAGNRGQNIADPCGSGRPELPASLTQDFANVLSVAAVAPSTWFRNDNNGQIPQPGPDGQATFTDTACEKRTTSPSSPCQSNYGDLTDLKSATGSGGIDLAAPGVVKSLGPGAGVSTFTGTSAAAPFVTGVAALVFALGNTASNPCGSPACVKQLLKATADDNSYSWKKGPMRRLNALAAVTRLLPPQSRTAVTIADTGAGALYTFPVDPMTPFGNGTPLGTVQNHQGKFLAWAATTRIATELAGPLVESPDGRHVYAAAAAQVDEAGSTFSTVKTLSTQTWQVEAEVSLLTLETPTDLAVSHNGRFLFVSTLHEIIPIDLRSNEIIVSLPEFASDTGDVTELPSVRAPKMSSAGLAFGRLSVAPDDKRLYAIVNSGDGGGVQEGFVQQYNIDVSKDCASATGLQPCYKDFLKRIVPSLSVSGGDRPIALGIGQTFDSEIRPLAQRLYLVHGGLDRIFSRNADPVQLTSAIVRDILFGGGLGSASDILTAWSQFLADGEIVIAAPGITGVFDTTGKTLDSFDSYLTVGWRQLTPSLIPGPGRTLLGTVLPSSSIYARRPFDIAVRPDGRRALLPFYHTGNFGVLDQVTQKSVWWRGEASDFLSGVAAVTPSLRLDRFAWPVKLDVDTGREVADPDGEAQLFPTRIRYSQNGRFAVAVHTGSFTSGPQRGAFTLIDDQAITRDLDNNVSLIPEAGGRPYFSVLPLDRQATDDPAAAKISAPILGVGDDSAATFFASAQGVAIQPVLTILTPSFGDVLWQTSPIHVQWNAPSRLITKIRIVVDDQNGTRLVDIEEAAGPWVPFGGYKRSLSQLITNAPVCPTDGCDLRITAIASNGTDEVSRTVAIVKLKSGG